MRLSSLLVVVVACHYCSGADAKSSLLAQEDASRPISKVITLLQDMVKQLQHEAEQDEEVYETMGCWCKVNDREKTQSISDAQQRIVNLQAAIESLTGKSAQLNSEIENLNSEINKNEEALDKATALRKKQMAEFNTEEKDMLQTIRSLKGAVTTLSKHHGASALIQQSLSVHDNAVMEATILIQKQLHEHSELLTPHQKKVAESFLASPDDYFADETSLLQQEQPQSGEIFGILKAMQESFETNLAQSQKEETENQSAFEDLKAAKKEELKAGQAQIDTKTTELGNTDEKNAQSKQDLEDTRESLAADTAFLANLKTQCANIDQEYEERTKTRQLEIGAVSKALEFLSGDNAADLFARSSDFVQRRSESALQRAHVVSVLAVLAKRSGDPRISALAVSTRIAAFGKVKETIQEMVDNLTKEKEEEIKHRDFCIAEFNNNERMTASKDRDQADLEAKVDDLTMQIDELAKAIEVLTKEIAELYKQIKRAGENREKENAEFQPVVADQKATQKLLKGALNVLKDFYEKAALLQKNGQKAPEAAGPPPPAGFKNYQKNKSSGGVMGMIEDCIQDSKEMEAEAMRGEEDAQKAYEDFTKDSNDSIEAKTKDRMNKREVKAKAEVEKVEAETELEAVIGELKMLANAKADLHKSCDYTMKNFDLRQSTRGDEIDSLKEAIAIFSGASFGALLQNSRFLH